MIFFNAVLLRHPFHFSLVFSWLRVEGIMLTNSHNIATNGRIDFAQHLVHGIVKMHPQLIYPPLLQCFWHQKSTTLKVDPFNEHREDIDNANEPCLFATPQGVRHFLLHCYTSFPYKAKKNNLHLNAAFVFHNFFFGQRYVNGRLNRVFTVY